jgi:hypothetical protein
MHRISRLPEHEQHVARQLEQQRLEEHSYSNTSTHQAPPDKLSDPAHNAPPLTSSGNSVDGFSMTNTDATGPSIAANDGSVFDDFADSDIHGHSGHHADTGWGSDGDSDGGSGDGGD